MRLSIEIWRYIMSVLNTTNFPQIKERLKGSSIHHLPCLLPCLFTFTQKGKKNHKNNLQNPGKTSPTNVLCILNEAMMNYLQRKKTKRKSIYSILSFYCFAIIVMLLITRKKYISEKLQQKALRKVEKLPSIHNDSS